MVNLPAAALAAIAVFLMATAVIAMTIRELRIAGFCFLSASLVIYIRETYFVEP